MREYALYFDDVLMDTFELTETEFNQMLESVGAFEYEDQNGSIKEDWETIGGNDNPKITYVDLTTMEKYFG